MRMVSDEDHQDLDRAAELLRHVIERHRGEDLRVLGIFTSALQGIRTARRYLAVDSPRRA